MPTKSFVNSPVYDPFMNVLSFSGIILHMFNQQWSKPTERVQFNPESRRELLYQKLTDICSTCMVKMIGEAKVPLVKECLDDDPHLRPTITTVFERIQESKGAHNYKKKSSQKCITLYT